MKSKFMVMKRLFVQNGQNRLFLNLPFASIQYPFHFLFLRWILISLVSVFVQNIPSKLGKICLYFLNFFSVSHCAAWRLGLAYPSIWKVAFSKSHSSLRTWNPLLLQLGKLTGDIHWLLALHRLIVRSQRKIIWRQRSLKCWSVQEANQSVDYGFLCLLPPDGCFGMC